MKRGWLEVLGFALSLLALVAVVAFLLYAEFAGLPDGAQLVISDVRLEAPDEKGTQAARFVLRNEGDLSVIDPTVEITATTEDGQEVTNEASFDYLPKGGRREGMVVFPAAVDSETLEYRVMSYVLP